MSAKCMCPLSCDSNPDQMVCGSDGKDYRNECELHQHACKNQKNIRVQYQGPCVIGRHAAIRTGLISVRTGDCLFNAVCLVEQLGARCSCDPIECDDTYKPLCGKDGRTFPNDCSRRKAECLSKSLIPIKHPGPCGEWS
ncbi:hypothetical protein GOODEAATRI_010708 [Goodea atripinnis]|uniref:Kazal-like domain-containing protein n=1 Tax=Goodea atripinnis TaxID=208336 RepID=A0ABV0P3C0_9TELE